MRVLNPNYLWTCDPYTVDHNYMLSKTFKMCDPVVDDGKLDALFCGIICASPPGSPLSQASEISGNESQDIFCTRDVDLKCILDDCNPAAKALAELQVTLQLEYNELGVDASRVDVSELSSLPVNGQDACLPTVARFVEVLSADPGAVHETTGNGPCSGSPLLPSSATNPPLPVPIKTRVPLAPISAEQCTTVAQASRSATATRKATLTTTASMPVPGLSLPVCTLGGTNILSSQHGPARLTQNSTSLEATGNTPYLLESKEQLSSSFVSTKDDKNNQWEHALQSGLTSSFSNGPTRNQTRAESSQTPTVDPVPVIYSERLTSRTPVTMIQFLTENKGKRKRSSNEVIEPTEKKRRVQNKGTKASPAVVYAVQPSSSTDPSTDSQNLPAQRRKRARKSTKGKQEVNVIDVDQEPLPLQASPSTFIPQSNGLRQLLPASMPVPRVPSTPPLSPGNGFAMPHTYPSSPSSVAQSHALGPQPFNAALPNNMGYGIPGVGYARNLGMPPGTFEQVSNYSAQYLERQRALLLRQQMQAQLQQARGMNHQTVGTSFVDPRLAPNGAAMPPMLAPTTTNSGIWSHHGPGGAGPFFQNSSLQSQVMEPLDTFGVTWMPPVQATATHLPNWYP